MIRALAVSLMLLFADDFNDGVTNPTLWTSGTGFYAQPINYYPAISVSEFTGELVFTHPGSLYWMANAYLSNSTYDVLNRRVSARLQRNNAEAWLAVGVSDTELVMAHLLNGGSTILRFAAHRAATDVYDYLTVQAADYSPTQDAYVGLRFTKQGVYCETSPDGVNWVTKGLIKGKHNWVNAARIELGGGGFFPVAGTYTSAIDDFKIE